jgi:hypothetical protein
MRISSTQLGALEKLGLLGNQRGKTSIPVNLRLTSSDGVTHPLLYPPGNLLLCREDSHLLVHLCEKIQCQQRLERSRFRVSDSGTILRVVLAAANCAPELFRTVPFRGEWA